MSRSFAFFSVRAFFVLVAVVVVGCGFAYAQRIDMRDTSHNLARGGNLAASDARQICVFCHTPMDNDDSDAVLPMWQRSVSVDQPFIMFDDIGQQGQAGNQSVGSQSIACLSCHDASQAYGISGGGQDHPFAVPYRGALSPEDRRRAREEARRANRLMNPAGQVKSDEDFRDASRGIIDNRAVWWVSRGGLSTQRGRFDVPLYVRIDPYDQAEIPFVECASCHDPHNVRPHFLRVDASASELCMTCHIK